MDQGERAQIREQQEGRREIFRYGVKRNVAIIYIYGGY